MSTTSLVRGASEAKSRRMGRRPDPNGCLLPVMFVPEEIPRVQDGSVGEVGLGDRLSDRGQDGGIGVGHLHRFEAGMES